MKKYLLVFFLLGFCDILIAATTKDKFTLFEEFIQSFPEWNSESSSLPKYLKVQDMYGVVPKLYGDASIPQQMVDAFIPTELKDTTRCVQKYFGYGNRITREKDYVLFLTGECPIEDTKPTFGPYREEYIIIYSKDGVLIDFSEVCRYNEESCGDVSQRSKPLNQIIAQANILVSYTESEEPNLVLPLPAEVRIQELKITKKGKIRKKNLDLKKAMVVWDDKLHRMSIQWPVGNSF